MESLSETSNQIPDFKFSENYKLILSVKIRDESKKEDKEQHKS